MKNNTLLIIGMHRSGTSLVTQWLHRCGLHVGDQLLEAGIGNKEGHFEDLEFLNLHRQWLKNRSQPYEDGFVSGALPPLTVVEQQQAKLLVADKNKKHEQWGWKEPRTCLWLPLYRQLLPTAYNLVIARSFNDTVNSLVMREYRQDDLAYQKKLAGKKGLSKLKWRYLKRKSPEPFFKMHATAFLKVWVYYYEEILGHLSKISPEQYRIVQYENLLRDDRSVYDTLTNKWGFALRYIPFTSVFNPGLLSDTRDIAPYVNDPGLLQKARQLETVFDEMMQLAQPAKVLQPAS